MGTPRTSSRSWQAALSRVLRQPAEPSTRGRPWLGDPHAAGVAQGGRAPRVAVVGIGNELRSDDAAGVAVARALQMALAGLDGVLVVDAGLAPEGCSGLLRRFGPELVLFVDAADVGGAPGTVRLLGRRSMGGVGGSTHTLPLSLLAGYLAEELGCRVALVGIQPSHTALGEPLSPPVGHAVNDVVANLSERLAGWGASGDQWRVRPSRDRPAPMVGGGVARGARIAADGMIRDR